MRYKSEYCDCFVDVKENKFIIQCPIHKEPNDVFRHNVGINKSRGNQSRADLRLKHYNKELPQGLRIAIARAGEKIIEKLRRAFSWI